MTDTSLDRGIGVVRAALKARKFSDATLVRDLGVSADTLRAFAGGATLTPSVMDGLVRVLFGGQAAWDHERAMMASANKAPARPLGVIPGRYVPTDIVAYGEAGDPPPLRKPPADAARPKKSSWF